MSEQKTKPIRLCGSSVANIRELDLNPSLRKIRTDLEALTHARRGTDVVVARGLITIPVNVHVVYHTDDENISDHQIDSQIAVLNQDFRATNADISNIPMVWRQLATDSQIEFRLNDVTRTHSNVEIFNDDDGVKFTARGGHDVVTPDTHLNIWVCNLTPWLGYAYFPGVRPEVDGIVVGHKAFGTNGTAEPPFNLGRTSTHEVGHYLNLHHIWGGDTPVCGDSDMVSDTPNQSGPNYENPLYLSISCNNGPHGDMFMNYMDYVNDESMFMFTAQQVVRMRTALSQARPGLGSI